MADKYADFETLSQHEIPGIDFRITLRRAAAALIVAAPHGGGIEAGTSEIANAIAGAEYSFYSFEGLKSTGNSDLHITSTRYDEPLCLELIRQSDVVIAVHGEGGESASVFLGGRDKELGRRLRDSLNANGFKVRRHPNPELQGLEPRNICNRGKLHRGVQLELSRGLRERMFESLSKDGRQNTTPTFNAFVHAIRSALKPACAHAAQTATRG
jgi:phage replication-related protein YjqB (UPF0714/DUF867 family)